MDAGSERESVYKERENLLIDDMDDTVCNEEIGLDDFGAIDEDVFAINGNGKVVAVQSLEHRPVHERGAIAHGTGVDNMIPEDALDLLDG